MNCDQDRPADCPSVTRRGFRQGAATAAVGGLAAAPSAWAAGRAASIRNIHHVTIDYDKTACCGHPRQGGVKSFGNGELVVLYRRAPGRYASSQDVSDCTSDGDMSRADVVLRRSHDGGLTWSPEGELILWSDSLPREKRGEYLCQNPAERPVLDMSRPETMFFFGRTSIRLTQSVHNTKLGWTSQWNVVESQPGPKTGTAGGSSTVFQNRSADKGRTWDRVPLVLDRPPRARSSWKDNRPLATMPDGALVGVLQSEDAVWLYGSESQGMTWQYLSQIALGTPEAGRPCGAGLVLLPSGRLQCYLLLVGKQSSTLCLSESDDCFAWSEPRPMIQDIQTPWPLRLRDGRMVVIYARRGNPSGIAAIVSADDGKTWSNPALIRDDASGPDSGGPVATQLDYGHLFTAYGWQWQDGNPSGRTRFVAGSLFELD
jgi:hypothetical protein